MKKLFLALSICFCLQLSLHAQDATVIENNQSTGKMVYAELGGPGVVFSFNFDSRFSSGTTLGFGYRLGLGFSFADELQDNWTNYPSTRSVTYATIPLGLNYVFGKPNSPHTFEVGAGATILTKKMHIDNSDNWFNAGDAGNLIGHASFMYRRQPLDGGFTWRIGFTPILGTSADIILSAAVGIGYAF